MALDDGTQNAITQNLSQRYGNQLITEFSVNPSLVGGVRIQVGSDVLMEASVAAFKPWKALSASHNGSFLFFRPFSINTMSNLVEEIEAQMAGAKQGVAKKNVGVVREISDGVAKIEGLTDCMLNEMLDFGNGTTSLALNLEETEVGAIILGEYFRHQRGRRSQDHG